MAVEGPIDSDASGIVATGQAGITFAFFSPYIIAAMPGGEADPATDGATHGAVLEAKVGGEIPVDVSINNGLSFKPAGVLKGDGRIDFTDEVKGRNQYLLRLHLDKDERVSGLRLRTIVTLCRAVYPQVKAEKTAVTYLAGGHSAFDASPDFTSKQLATAPTSFVSSENLVWSGYDTVHRVAWGMDADDATCIYRVTAPAGDLAGVSAAADVTCPSPMPKGAWGSSHKRLGQRAVDDAAQDRRPGRRSGRQECPAVLLALRLCRPVRQRPQERVCTGPLQRRGAPCGIRYMYLYGTYEAGNTSPLAITYHWKSGEALKEHTETIPAGQARHTYTINTGKDVENVKVVFAVPATK